MLELELHLKEHGNELDRCARIVDAADSMTSKFTKYWKEVKLTHVLGAFFHPRYKHRLLEYFLIKRQGYNNADAAREVGGYLKKYVSIR